MPFIVIENKHEYLIGRPFDVNNSYCLRELQ